MCALVYFVFISQQDKKLDKQYEENTKSLFCPSVSHCLNAFLQPPPPAGARHTDLRETAFLPQLVFDVASTVASQVWWFLPVRAGP